jgi:hypothetical protein
MLMKGKAREHGRTKINLKEKEEKGVTKGKL